MHLSMSVFCVKQLDDYDFIKIMLPKIETLTISLCTHVEVELKS